MTVRPLAQRDLNALMTKSTASALPEGSGRDSAGSDTMQACRALSDRIHPGLDLSSEIEALKAQDLGELVLLQDEAELVGFAVMHCGAATEAGSGTAYVKFGAARDAASFGRLLKAAESTARRRGLEQLVAGINTARSGAYRQMLAHGYRSTFLGVAMQLHDRPGFNRPDCFVIDDWR